MKVVFATQNLGKLREAAEILGDGIELLTPQDCGVEGEAEETGTTFSENSLLKARYVSDRLPADRISSDGISAVIADDSGLEVDALGGEPGIYTARYAGGDKNFADNMDKLLTKLGDAGADTPRKRAARFRCLVTLIRPDGNVFQYDGTIEGRIAPDRSGDGGFGYDPVFIPDDGELDALSSAGLSPEEIVGLRGKTLAEIPEHLKNLISHRSKALQPVTEALRGMSAAASGGTSQSSENNRTGNSVQ